jgi:hypothetical protein
VPGERLDDATVAQLDESVEIDIRTPRRDGSTSSRPVWVVVVDGEAYVRSYLAERGAWYRRARRDGRMTIAVGETTLPVAVEPIADPELDRRVSDAFRAKYGARSRQSTEAMVTDEVVATTLRLRPA